LLTNEKKKKEKERGREENGDKLHTSSVTHEGEEGSHDRDGKNYLTR
jgi:hypothetical protein